MSVIISPSVKILFDTVRAIKIRINQNDVKTLSFPEIYQKMTDEFPTFASQQPRMFVRLIETTKPEMTPVEKQKVMDNICSVLYYRDKVVRGLITEEEVADIVAGRYLTPELKAESDRLLKKMRDDKARVAQAASSSAAPVDAPASNPE